MGTNGLNTEIGNRIRQRGSNRKCGKHQTDGCSLNSDSSALSDLWDDDSSTMYTSTDSIDESDCIVDLKTSRQPIVGIKKHNKQKLSHRSMSNSVATAITAVTKCTKSDSYNHSTSNDHKKDKNNRTMFSEDEYDNDNDSAFYSGRRTATKTNSSSSSASFGQQQEKKGKHSNNVGVDGNNGNSCGIINSFVKLRICPNNKNSKSTKQDNKGCGGTDSADSGIKERDESDYHTIDGSHPSLTSTNSNTGSSKQPRTSAEFEEIFLKKNGSGNDGNDESDWPKSKPNHNRNNARASTLPSAITSFLHIPTAHKNRSETPPVVELSNNKNSTYGHSTKSLLSSVHLSTITHLTSLAKNIRLASMGPLGKSHHLTCNNSSNTHSKSKFDPILCKFCNVLYFRF